MQDVHGQLACRLVAKLRVSRDGVLDQFNTEVVGRTERCWRSHRISFSIEPFRSATEPPDTSYRTPISVAAFEHGQLLNDRQPATGWAPSTQLRAAAVLGCYNGALERRLAGGRPIKQDQSFRPRGGRHATASTECTAAPRA